MIAIFLVAESEIETVPWTKENKKTHGRTQELCMEMTHETTGMFTSLRVIDRTIVIIHATDIAKDMTPQSVKQSNKIVGFDLSHLAITEDTIAQTKPLALEMYKTDHNHRTKTNNMTSFLIWDDEATTIHPGH